MKIAIKKCKDNAMIPTYGHVGDAGIDLYACGTYLIPPRKEVKINTGIALSIPTGHVGLIWDKSSVGAKGIKTLGGVIDATYRGEIQILVYNLGEFSYTFEHGQKVAQLLIQKCEQIDLEEVATLDETSRGTDGFGSTGL